MAITIYFLCALASGACAVALVQEYRRQRTRLLLWSSVAFGLLALNNALVFADFVLLPARDLAVARAGAACLGMAALLFGLVWEAE